MLKVPSDGSGMSDEHDVPKVDLESAARELAYQMAYGLSHELNNPLANIAARARLLAETEPNLQRRQQLSAIVDQAMRGCEMIADLMLFARPPEGKPEVIEVAGLVDRLVQRARHHVPIGIDVSYSPDPRLTHVKLLADVCALEEAIWAVLRNSLEVARARVEVSMKLDELIGEAVIEIKDDGPGLTVEAQKYAFHPFFSGREAGRGIGLGLSKARRFLEMNHGSLSLISETTGCRACVRLKLSS